MMLYRLFRSFFRGLLTLTNRYESIGQENIPKSGGVMLCSNHISNWDPILLGCGMERQVHFMAKAELFKIPVVKNLITAWGAFPVNRGAGDRQSLRTALKVLEDGKCMGLFPEGHRSKTGELGEGQTGVAFFAMRSDCAVVPIAIVGSYKLFRKIRIVYGKPLDLSKYREGKSSKETLALVTQDIMNAIDELRKANRMEVSKR
ncbi:lysophospholipid acyltransferase family protein [Tumebacillus flagellatus]|uniref:Acyl-phosphate glycerol 3-phosphate acyltransferase n=1 Tax=Tumebacillus flagellatus TaxID=1157490 RepID=A0A074LRF8_9BACL|nr:lysophospholipid acyltransferase family protein [Tumebacillus flagellatus]KEO83664.1 acyl-phosphate glycerol 3-phosphate acyltransferase [Tumebacillus flagellatus]